MTLNDFIAKKPADLRLGQWFVNCYWKGSDSYSHKLYQIDGRIAELEISLLMSTWQWDSLPDVDTNGNKI